MPAAIEVEGLSKRYGERDVVDDLSFTAQAGRITGFLGPNGAGKTQTIRMLLGLVRPTHGRALLAGRPLAAHAHPASVVGCVLDGCAFHPGRTARAALHAQARIAGAAPARADAQLERAGLAHVAGQRVGTFSLGMRQRLALAQSLLADPEIVIADEPVNGLDPAGIVWIRGLLRELAAEGRTVLISSHLLAEAELLIDDVVVIASGRLVADGPLALLQRDGMRLEQHYMQLTA